MLIYFDVRDTAGDLVLILLVDY